MKLVEIITKVLGAEAQEWGKVPTSHHPSSATSEPGVGACLRKLYYRLTGTPQSNPADWNAVWKMERGNDVHEAVVKILEKEIEFIDEISFKKRVDVLELPISGRVDGLYMEDGKMKGLEIKSSFGAYIATIQRDNTPRESDLLQVAIYLACNEDIESFQLLYIGRDSGNFIEFCITRNMVKNLFEKIVDRFKTLESVCAKKELPEREYKLALKWNEKSGEIMTEFQKDKVKFKSDWQCKYCGYCDTCWKEVLEKVKAEKGMYIPTEYTEEE